MGQSEFSVPQLLSGIPHDIFTAVLETAQSLPRDGGETPFELIAMQVSRYWHDTIISSPRMWTTLSITRLTSKSLINLYLERSKALLLDISILGHRGARVDCLEFDQGLLSEILFDLRPHISRLQRFQVELDFGNAPLLFIALQGWGAPFLEELRVYLPSMPPSFTLFSGGTPRLTNLHVPGVSLASFQLSLAGLTHLHLCSAGFRNTMSFDSLIQALQTSPNLEHLWLMGLFLDWPWPNSLQHYRPIVLPQLRSFEISDRQSRTCLPLLAISAPALHSLTLHNFVSDDFPRALSNIIRRNVPNVRSLTLVGPELRASDTTHLPHIFPLITDLVILRIKPRHHALSQLLQKDPLATGSLVWPNLTSITVAPVPDSINFLLYLVKSRTHQGHPLKTLVLPHPETIKQIDQLKSQVDVQPCSKLQCRPYVKEVLGEMPQTKRGPRLG